MISISDFSKEFNYRHNFNAEDIGILQQKYPNIKFVNIPEAWIICVDNMLQCLKEYNIRCIQQYYGFLSVIGDYSSEAKEIIKFFEGKMYQADADLHKDLS